jgi:hypothetical protein
MSRARIKAECFGRDSGKSSIPRSLPYIRGKVEENPDALCIEEQRRLLVLLAWILRHASVAHTTLLYKKPFSESLNTRCHSQEQRSRQTASLE